MRSRGFGTPGRRRPPHLLLLLLRVGGRSVSGACPGPCPGGGGGPGNLFYLDNIEGWRDIYRIPRISGRRALALSNEKTILKT